MKVKSDQAGFSFLDPILLIQSSVDRLTLNYCTKNPPDTPNIPIMNYCTKNPPDTSNIPIMNYCTKNPPDTPNIPIMNYCTKNPPDTSNIPIMNYCTKNPPDTPNIPFISLHMNPDLSALPKYKLTLERKAVLAAEIFFLI